MALLGGTFVIATAIFHRPVVPWAVCITLFVVGVVWNGRRHRRGGSTSSISRHAVAMLNVEGITPDSSGTTGHQSHVACPRCGTGAADQRFCLTCGLRLSAPWKTNLRAKGTTVRIERSRDWFESLHIGQRIAIVAAAIVASAVALLAIVAIATAIRGETLDAKVSKYFGYKASGCHLTITTFPTDNIGVCEEGPSVFDYNAETGEVRE